MRKRWILAGIAALIAGAVWLSWQNAQSFVPAATSAIERGLGRKVQINGEAHFLPWRFGFSLRDVVIQDDPRFGVEPLAYVDELQASIRLTALLRGRLEFAKLSLIAPSVNLAQNATGWNFPALLNQALGATGADAVAPPEVEVTGGRLNVRFGETKSVYYLWDANLTLEAGSRPDQLSIYFDGVPARTNRGTKLPGFGRLSARGTVDLAGARNIKLQAALERSAASELLLLFQDRGSSVTGFFSGTGNLQGPLDALQIDGRLQLTESQRWAWLTGPGRGPAIDWGGILNWTAQTVHLNTRPEGLPVGVSVDGKQLLGSAQWNSKVVIRDTPAEALAGLAQEFGFALPGRMALAGNLNGDLNYTTKAGTEGKIDFSGGSLSLASKEMADVEPTSLRFDGRNAKLDPVVIRQGTEVVRLEAAYDWAANGAGLSWAFSGPELDLGRAREWGMALPGRVQSGKWRGDLRFEAATGGWQGEGELIDAALDVEGLNAKVHLDSARVRLQGAQFSLNRMAGRIDDVDFHGEFQYNPAAPVHSQLQLQLGDVALGAAPAWLAQATDRSNGVLSRTLGLANAPVPDWIADRRLSAQLQFQSLRMGDHVIAGPLALRASWSGGVVQIVNLTGPGRLRGEGRLALVDGQPPSSFGLENLPWHEGLADVTIELDALRSPRQGKFSLIARDAKLVDEQRWLSTMAEGTFEARGSSSNVAFSKIEIHPRPGDEGGVLKGTGQSGPDGTWEWSLQGAGKPLKIVGPVFDGVWKEIP